MTIEQLENRRYLSFNVIYSSANRTLTVTGSTGNDSVLVTYHPYSEDPELEFNEIGDFDDGFTHSLNEAPVANIVFDMKEGNDTVGIGVDTIFGQDATNFPFAMQPNGGPGNDIITTGAKNDSIRGGDGNDSIRAGKGNDTVDGGGGQDTTIGGDGTDRYSNSSRTSPLSLTLDGIRNDGAAGELDFIENSFEDITGGSGNDTITGDSRPNLLKGGAGNDLIHGGAEFDQIFGEAGRDTLFGDDGNDQFFCIEAPPPSEVDSISGGNGNDVASCDGRAVQDVFNQFAAPAGFGPAAGPGVEDITDATVEIRTNGPDVAIFPSTSNDTISLSQSGSNLTVTRNGVPVTFNITGVTRIAVAGGLGNDTLFASTSVIVPLLMNGNEGNDSLVGGSAADSIKGGTGNDSLNGGEGNDTLDAGDNNDRLVGGGGNDSLLGGAGDDTLIGQGGNDVFNGGDGIDTADYSTSTSAQRVSIDNVANDGSATLAETDNVQSTVENILGGSGNDTLTGSTGANAINGNGGNDSISGLSGNDTLTGGSGRDILLGGDNADLFFTNDGEIDTIRGGNGADQDGAVDDIDDAIY